ncbi:CocE/NonD family hydrolase [Shewanella sedimentimangrovi]|uniref:CocE/NonD family hydrolase n=1 Tax=Shewanella sedimentimangrovi TaxID=2814293 RepID=A0ABX7R3Y1_9GAMM|nr:CocE/NonD family hydrolase [Shewanella sedimentimangrovi]QSX37871.1 CocE/NonD family hydrolase [Shewanella sedimentimangrovi]
MPFIRIWIIAFVLSLLSPHVGAADDPQQTAFANPLQSLTSDSRDAVVQQLNDPAWYARLSELARQLSPDQLAAQNAFNKTALLAARGEHQALLALLDKTPQDKQFYFYRLDALFPLPQGQQAPSADKHLHAYMDKTFGALDDEQLVKISQALNWSIPMAEDYTTNIYKEYRGKQQLALDEAISLIANTELMRVLYRVLPAANQRLNQQLQQRFDIQPEVIITTAQGVELAATIVRKKGVAKPLPTALQFTIYADESSHIKTAIHAAAHGYVGIVANSRGKRGSRNQITPWEHDGEDAAQVIDWIARQAFSDGRVVMYGGSYNGFTQWAATKFHPKALKTIVPYAAASPITGLPIENNIVLTANYQWAFHVTNNKTMDNSVYADWQKAKKLRQDLFESGRPIVDIDKIDGQPNPWFQKWLQHPDYDDYYQAMLPYRNDYAKIDIPVLSITGYFDGGQISALDFIKRHVANNPQARNYLLIGPYDHHTAQYVPSQYYSNYELDPAAMDKDTEEIAFAWFDHVLYDKPMPTLIKDRVNYQLMGSNSWQHAPSLNALNSQGQNFYLTGQATKEGYYLLSPNQPKSLEKISMRVDMADRSEQRNRSPWPMIQSELLDEKGAVFVTPPFDKPMRLAGMLSGYFSLAINKRDLDIGYNLYELTKDGQYIHLVHYISRASYAADMNKRTLLEPGNKTRIPMTNTRMTAKLLAPGSRLVMVLNVNKNEIAQVNLGTGNPVNTERLADAGEPLALDWFSDSLIHIPLTEWQATPPQLSATGPKDAVKESAQ